MCYSLITIYRIFNLPITTLILETVLCLAMAAPLNSTKQKPLISKKTTTSQQSWDAVKFHYENEKNPVSTMKNMINLNLLQLTNAVYNKTNKQCSINEESLTNTIIVTMGDIIDIDEGKHDVPTEIIIDDYNISLRCYFYNDYDPLNQSLQSLQLISSINNYVS